MAYPRRLLNEGEEIALDLRPHWWFFSKHILTGIPLAIVLVLITGLSGTSQDVALWIAGIAFVAWAVWLAIRYMSWHQTQFVVTNKRVIYRTGVIRRHGVEVPLGRINNIVFRQGLWERVIGAGDLVIESAGESGQSTFTDVQHPDAVQQEVYRRMDENARDQASWGAQAVTAATTAAAAPAPSPGDDAAEKIRRLAELRDSGAITEQEYEEKKAELLDRM